MPLIDIGDLALSNQYESRQSALFHAIREKIVQGLWSKGNKLPSTRKLSMELTLSRNTVINAYEQLQVEGYIESKPGSGYYVSLEQPEHYLSAPASNCESESRRESESRKPKANRAPNNLTRSATVSPELDVNSCFAPGVPDLAAFPFAKWQRLHQRHIGRTRIAGNQQVQGSQALREALSGYLASSRSVLCQPNRIIITCGAQQAISIALMATLQAKDSILMEEPGYRQIHKIIDLYQLNLHSVPVHQRTGLDLPQVLSSDARALYVTPSNQYPMGTSLNTEQRLQLIEWAQANQSWIIEDDYDSEFQFAHRPYTSMQGLAGKLGHDDRILYVGSLSKVMFNGLRLGYLVVPESLVERCLAIKDALSGDSASHTQEALADFIDEGDLIRHIRKMRRLYKQKHQAMVDAIEQNFGQDIEVISQAAGLHLTLKWRGYITETQWQARAVEEQIVIRPMSFYEYQKGQRDWSSVVLGFGNIGLQDIPNKVKQIADIFYRKEGAEC